MWETDQSAPCSSSGSQPNLSDSLVWSTGETPGEPGGGVTMVRTRSAEDIRCVPPRVNKTLQPENCLLLSYSLRVVLKFDVFNAFISGKQEMFSLLQFTN